MFVIFEGLDKSGKGTLEHALLKATNFKHVVIDRGPVGYWVFDKIFNRETETGNNEYINNISFINSNNDKFKVIYLYADETEVLNRMSRWGESCMYDYGKAQQFYLENMSKYENVLVLDTSKFTIEECVNKIVTYIGGN